MTTPTTITCKECGHSNESQRIYCHNCGVKLDRSILPPEATLEETQEDVRKRVTSTVTPQTGFFARGWQSALETLAWSILAAVLVQVCRTPDGVPVVRDDLVEKPMIPMLMNRAMLESTSTRLSISEEIANNYLGSTIKPAETGLYDKELKFLRAFVHFKKGTCEFATEQSIFDYPLYVSAIYKLQIADNKVNAICVGGSLGRMPVHPLIMQYGGVLFQTLWDVLSREHNLIDKMQLIELNEREIVLETKPARQL